MFDTIVVGAGQAGLGVALELAARGLGFVVLERGQVGETWRRQRWDSFVLNTPNWMNQLPGQQFELGHPEAFAATATLLHSFEAAASSLPVVTDTEVHRLAAEDDHYRVESSRGVDLARTVVIASGGLNVPRIPAVAATLPDRLVQLHTGGYRSPDDLPPGAVLVIGGGQSGAQIVEDLRAGGRDVYFSISAVARLPRRYRGRDLMSWMTDLGMWDTRPNEVDDPAMLRAANPLTSGVGLRGHTVSYQALAAAGVTLLGRFEQAEGEIVHTDGRAGEYVAFSDEASTAFRAAVDALVDERGLDAPLPEQDPADVPAPPGLALLEELDLAAAGVTTVIWATGFGGDFSWIDLPIVDGRSIAHTDGATAAPGVFCLGLGWTSNRRSGVIAGIADDARRVAASVEEYVRG